MTTGAANGLLKFIEEPTGNVVSFLISKNRNLVLPTIISRTQVVEFPSLSKKLMVKELQSSGVKPSEVNLMISITNSLDQIKGWLKDDWFASTQKMLEKWFIYLVKDNSMAMPFVQMSLMPLITNKDRQRIVISMMLSLFDDVLETKYGTLAEERVKYPSILEQTKLAASKWRNDQILKMLDELLDVNKSMAVNVNFQNIIEALTLKILEISKS